MQGLGFRVEGLGLRLTAEPASGAYRQTCSAGRI